MTVLEAVDGMDSPRSSSSTSSFISDSDDDDRELYEGIDGSDSDTVYEEEYSELELHRTRAQKRTSSLGMMRLSSSAHSLPLALGTTWNATPSVSSSSLNTNSHIQTHTHMHQVQQSMSTNFLPSIACPSTSGRAMSLDAVQMASIQSHKQVSSSSYSKIGASRSHGDKMSKNDIFDAADSTSSSPRPRVSFRLDLTALTSAKPMVRVVSQPELNRHAIATTMDYDLAYIKSSSSYSLCSHYPAALSPPSLLKSSTSVPAAVASSSQMSHANNACRNNGFPDNAYHHNHHGSDAYGHNNTNQTILNGNGAAMGEHLPPFAARQASLSRRLQVRPSVDRLVGNNILFGPDLSPSISAVARAFKWRRNSDELNHRLSRRASRDSLIEHNILRLESNSQLLQFKHKQVALQDRMGSRSSRESLVERKILLPRDQAQNQKENVESIDADTSMALSPQSASTV